MADNVTGVFLFPWGSMNIPEFIGYMGAVGAFICGIYKFVWETKLKSTNERMAAQERFRVFQADENRRLREDMTEESRRLREDMRAEIARLREEAAQARAESEDWRKRFVEKEFANLELQRQIAAMEKEIHELRLEVAGLRKQIGNC